MMQMHQTAPIRSAANGATGGSPPAHTAARRPLVSCHQSRVTETKTARRAAATGAESEHAFGYGTLAAHRSHRSIHPRTVSYHWMEFAGLRTQWFSSGKYRSFDGIPSRCSAVKDAMPWVSTTR
jgi:hypothetical protein